MNLYIKDLVVFCHHRSHARIHHRLGVLTVAWSALVSPLPLSTCWVLVSHHRSQAWKHHGFVGSTFRACVHASTELSAPAQRCCTSRCCHTYMPDRDAALGQGRAFLVLNCSYFSGWLLRYHIGKLSCIFPFLCHSDWMKENEDNCKR